MSRWRQSRHRRAVWAVLAMAPQALNVNPASIRPAIERAARKRRMGDRGYQKQTEKRRILIRLSSSYRSPGGIGYLPEMIGEGSVLRRTWMKAIGGQPVIATTRLAADLRDVGILETCRVGFCPSDRIECVDSRAQVTGRSEGRRTWQW